MIQQKIFESLASNAFDFLNRAISEFDKAPKYSAINFCAAVEMLLKARLMREHWSLIVSKPDQASLAKFTAGDFISVTLEESRVRLKNIARDDIGDDAFSSFRSLVNHRNKMVHFFHAEVDGDDDAKALIVAEHCRAWFYLHRLLDRWEPYFHDFHTEITRADRAMKGHRKYLSAKFKAIKRELDAARKAGNAPKTCGVCRFRAAIPKALAGQVVSLECQVCDHEAIQVAIDCPHCQKLVAVYEGYADCEHCNGAIEPDDLAEALTDHAAVHIAIPDGDESWRAANCSACEGFHTVIRLEGIYFCTNCFEVSDRIEWCEWCNEPNAGDMEYSYVRGCSHCEGKMGWEKDD